MRGAFVSKAASLTVTAVIGLLGSNPIQAERRAPNPAAQVQLVVDELKGRLTIPSEVTVLVVASNPLLVSVEPDKGRRGTFVMSFEETFLAQLDPTELRAVSRTSSVTCGSSRITLICRPNGSPTMSRCESSVARASSRSTARCGNGAVRRAISFNSWALRSKALTSLVE